MVPLNKFDVYTTSMRPPAPPPPFPVAAPPSAVIRPDPLKPPVRIRTPPPEPPPPFALVDVDPLKVIKPSSKKFRLTVIRIKPPPRPPLFPPGLPVDVGSVTE